MAAEIIPLKIVNFNGSFARNISRYIVNLALTADTARTYTAPANCAYALIASGVEIFHCHPSAGTAAVPTGDSLAGAGSARLRDNLYLMPGEQISLCSGTDTVIDIQLFRA